MVRIIWHTLYDKFYMKRFYGKFFMIRCMYKNVYDTYFYDKLYIAVYERGVANYCRLFQKSDQAQKYKNLKEKAKTCQSFYFILH